MKEKGVFRGGAGRQDVTVGGAKKRGMAIMFKSL